MPVVQTFARGQHVPDYLTLKKSSSREKLFIKTEMEKQLKLVSHALIRGQNLPKPEDHGFTIDRRHLANLRAANINNVGTSNEGAPAHGEPSVFEAHFSMHDIAAIILDHLPIKDMKALAGVSKTCRTMVYLQITTWDLGKLEMGRCHELYLAKKDYDVPRRIVWVHGQSDFDEKVARSRLSSARLFKTDAMFMAHPAVSYNLIYSGMSIASGKPFKRVTDNDNIAPMTSNTLSRVRTMHKNGSRLFNKIRDDDKKCVNYSKWIRIQSLLTGFANHGQNIRSLYLDKVPFLSISILNAALENLPELQELHIDNCELLHIGCLLTILDTLHWIGARRDRKFITLDFFPKTWFGPITGRTATCVVTFNPPNEPRVAMGVMVTFIIAAMKAAYMGFDIIREGSLLEKFLLLVPMPFGLASLFLSHLRDCIRILLKPEQKRSTYERILLNQLIGQILAATCVPNHDVIPSKTFHPGFAHLLVGECSQCKHVVLTHMLHPRYWGGASPDRTCMACILNSIVEADDHAWLREKRAVARDVFGSIINPPEDWLPPQPFDMICPVIKNAFVRHPQPTLIPLPNMDDFHDPFDDDDDDEAPDQDYATAFAQFNAAITAAPTPINHLNTGPTLNQIIQLNDHARREYLESIRHKLDEGRYVREEFRNIHRDSSRFWYDDDTTYPTALHLDSKNRFAQSIGMHVDDTAAAVQPRREWYHGRAAWEGIYRSNAAHQGRPITHDDRIEWKPPLLPTGTSSTVV